MRHVQMVHPHAVKVHNLSVRIGQQGKIQFVFGDEFLVAFGGIETDANNFDIILSASSPIRSRNPQASFVQPDVKSFG